MSTPNDEKAAAISGNRLCHRLNLSDLESTGGVIDDANVDTGWDDDSSAFLPCSAAFAE